MIKKITYAGLLGVLVYLTYGKALQFTFWKDDWFYLWNDLYVSHFLTPILLHPGTYVEFHIFSRLFGENPFFWQLFGLIVKVVASLSVTLLAMNLTHSKKTAVLSGIFFAVSSSGLESTVWISAHVTNMVVIFLSLGMSLLLKYIHQTQPKIFIFSIIFLLAGLITDPVRAIPIVGILIFVYFFLTPLSLRQRSKYLARFTIITMLILGAICVYVSRNLILNTPIMRFVIHSGFNVSEIFKKIHLIGQYFNSLFNLMTSWFITSEHYVNEASHGIYNRLFARLGALLLAACGTWIVGSWHKNRKATRYVLFFILWMMLFYIPDWLSEPRIIATGNHRYLTVSNVGYICLIAFIIANIRSKYISLVLCALFIFGNIASARGALAALYHYRSERIVSAVWDKIDLETPADSRQKLFIFSGDEPANTNIFVISGAAPFAIKRKISTLQEIPLVSNDLSEIARFICYPTASTYKAGNRNMTITNLSLDSVFAWVIRNDGTIINKSVEERQVIRERVASACSPIYL